MKAYTAALLIPLVAACAQVTDDTPGVVYGVRDGEVVVLGAREHAREPRPTQRMIEQAQEACPGATFHSALPSFESPDKFEYLFKC